MPSIYIEIILFTLAVSLDAFGAAFSYRIHNVKVPFTSVLTISSLCSAILIFAIVMGEQLFSFISLPVAKYINFFVLFSIGFYKLFEPMIIKYMKKKIHSTSIPIHSFDFLKTVYVEPLSSDLDNNDELSPKESVSLAFILSLDCFFAGLFSSYPTTYIPFILFSIMTLSILSLFIGAFLGHHITKKSPYNLSWLGGLLLMILAFIRYHL